MKKEIVRLCDVYCGDDRTSTGNGDIKTLAASIREVGLINDISICENANAREVMQSEGCKYRVVAGKRRYRALEHLGTEEYEFKVYEADDVLDLNDITLTENINRLDLDPIDEGELFQKLQTAGATIDTLAVKYDRSKSSIYQRIKLTRLNDDFKRCVKENKLSISAAAAIVDLPPPARSGISTVVVS